MQDTQSEFAENLSRIFKREKISEVLLKHNSLRKIVEDVKRSDYRQHAFRTAEKLYSNEFLVDKEIKELVTFLQAKLEQKFPEISGMALVIIGSSAHGGRFLRHALETDDDGDLDLGVVYDLNPQIGTTKRVTINEFLRDQVKDFAPSFGFSDNFHLCRVINPINEYNHNLIDSKEIYNSFLGNTLETDLRKILFYFQPSIPHHINENNRYFVLKALSDLRKTDLTQWKTVVDLLIEYWSHYHTLKQKHIAGKHTRRHYDKTEDDLDWGLSIESKSHQNLAQKTLKTATSTMSLPLRSLLESTGTNAN